MKSKVLFFSLLSALVMMSCGHKEESSAMPKATDAVSVKVLSLNKESHRRVIGTSGLFTTKDETILSFKTGGIIRQVLVNEGDVVRKGQVLATLDMTEIAAQVNQAEIALQKAERDFQRVERLYKDSVATLEQLQNARTGKEIATEQLSGARFNQQYSEIRATQDGYVLKKFANPGQVVGPGTPIIQTNGASNGQWVLKAAMSDADWSVLQEGDSAVIYTDAAPDRALKGLVSAKSAAADMMTGSFVVEIKPLSIAGWNIAAGLFGKAELFPKRAQDLWKVPYSAVLDGDGNKAFVFVTNNGQEALKVPVSIAGIEKDYVLINSGLENYPQLIVSGSAYLNDHSVIQVNP